MMAGARRAIATRKPPSSSLRRFQCLQHATSDYRSRAAGRCSTSYVRRLSLHRGRGQADLILAVADKRGDTAAVTRSCSRWGRLTGPWQLAPYGKRASSPRFVAPVCGSLLRSVHGFSVRRGVEFRQGFVGFCEGSLPEEISPYGTYPAELSRGDATQ